MKVLFTEWTTCWMVHCKARCIIYCRLLQAESEDTRRSQDKALWQLSPEHFMAHKLQSISQLNFKNSTGLILHLVTVAVQHYQRIGGPSLKLSSSSSI